MRALPFVGLLAAAGCDVVFGLAPPDAPPNCPPAPARTCGLTDPDEDGDSLRDACDPCPQFAEIAPADMDQDGVGDLCDPHPTVAATCRSRLFDGFSTADGWLDTTGWAFHGDAAYSGSGLAVLRSTEAHFTGRATALVEDGMALPAPDSIAGVLMLATADHGYACVIQQDPGGAIGKLIVLEIAHGIESVILADPTPFGVTPGNQHRVSLELSPTGQLECRSTSNADGSVERTLTTTLGALPPPGSVGLVARSTPARFEYLDFVPD